MGKVKDLEILRSIIDDLKEDILMSLIQELENETSLSFEPRGEDYENPGVEILRAETDLDYIYIEVEKDFTNSYIADICDPEDEEYREEIESVLERIRDF
jgi:hypothetical protein